VSTVGEGNGELTTAVAVYCMKTRFQISIVSSPGTVDQPGDVLVPGCGRGNSDLRQGRTAVSPIDQKLSFLPKRRTRFGAAPALTHNAAASRRPNRVVAFED